MRKDIEFPKVEGVQVAIARRKNDRQEYEWFAYLINSNEIDLHNVIITCRGYGEINGEQRKTSTVRYFFEIIPAISHCIIEPLTPELFALNSEYWVSYYIDDKIFDKQFIFTPE
ncbi:MAG: hypothetical protein RMJ97_12310, partial [Raineya sp.]|nr:hypothetical protein [Raineya sp.]